ncbi:MAG: class I SAM-dependent methyltransferase [Pseudomonadota bacterium]
MTSALTAGPCPLCGLALQSPAPMACVGARLYWRCVRCDLIWLTPAQRPSREEERAEYALHENDPDDAGYRRHLAKLTDRLSARAADGTSLMCLDFGSGPGPAIAPMMGERGACVANYDPFFAPDRSVLRPAHYDVITCTEVAEHFHDPAASFAQLAALVKPGGSLGVMTRLHDHAGCAFARWYYVQERSHVVFYSTSTMRWIADRFGWQVRLAPPDVAIFETPLA